LVAGIFVSVGLILSGRTTARPELYVGPVHAAEAAGIVAWGVANTGLIDTGLLDFSGGLPLHGMGMGDVVYASSPALASLGTEVSVDTLRILRAPGKSNDWQMNSKDWRFQILSCIPFGLLIIAISLQRTRQAEPRDEADECALTALAGLVPPETCGPVVAMAAVTSTRDLNVHDCES
jgi:hypothetical protein